MNCTKEKLMNLIVSDLPEKDQLANVEAASVLADHLIANGVTVQEWISVEERLPDLYQRVLVYCRSRADTKHVTACTYMGGSGYRQFSRRVHEVTHWMPLSEPPKEVRR